MQTILSFWCCASRALEISRIWTHTCSFSDHWGFASFKFCYFFTSVNPPLYVYSCNKSIGAININTNMSCLSWIFGMKYFVCLLRWLEPDFATEVTIFPLWMDWVCLKWNVLLWERKDTEQMWGRDLGCYMLGPEPNVTHTASWQQPWHGNVYTNPALLYTLQHSHQRICCKRPLRKFTLCACVS